MILSKSPLWEQLVIIDASNKRDIFFDGSIQDMFFKIDVLM